MSAIETAQITPATTELLTRPELVVAADRSKLTRIDEELLAKGGQLETLRDHDHLVEVHDTNNLFRNLKTLMLPESDAYRQGFQGFYEQVKFDELLKRVQNADPGLFALASHYAKKSADNFVALQKYTRGTPEYKALEAKQLQEEEAEVPQVKVCMSRLYEAMADVAPAVFENPGESQFALNSLV